MLFAISCSSTNVVAGNEGPVSIHGCEREVLRASRTHGIPLGVLYAVGLTESGSKGSLHPHAVNIDGVAYYPGSVSEAIELVRIAQRSGGKLIDVGCMQINLRFHGIRFKSLEDMFSPSRNVDYGAAFLSALRRRESGWTHAVARYHAGANNHSAQQRYVCAVVRKMVATGLGAWTESARDLCDK